MSTDSRNAMHYAVLRHAANGTDDDVICAPQIAYADLPSARAACMAELRAGSAAYIADASGQCQTVDGALALPRYPLTPYMLKTIAALRGQP